MELNEAAGVRTAQHRSMQSYREQSSYHGNQRLLHQEAQETSRLGDHNQYHQGQMFSGYTNRPVSESCDQQLYQPFRRDPTDYYYSREKELTATQAQRRLAGRLQTGYGAQPAAGYSVQYLSEGQWRMPHTAMPGYSHFEQDVYASQFSPAAVQQQLRHQTFQATPGSQVPSSSAHLSQLIHQSGSGLLAKYQHRAAQYNPQQFQSSSSISTTTTTASTTSSSSSPSSYLSPQGYSQPPGQAFDGYHTSAGGQCDGYPVNATVAAGYGTQAGYSYQPPVSKPCFEQAKPLAGQQHRVLQYSTPAKLALLNQQFASYCSADIPAKSPMPFHQNFSPGSNPSPAPPVAQSPSCSSTPSPLLVNSDSLQCGAGSMGMVARSRILQQMHEPSPTPAGLMPSPTPAGLMPSPTPAGLMPSPTAASLMPSPSSQSGAYEGFGLEGGGEKRVSDLGLSSLTALSSQVANIPNTVQHLLISESLALHRRHARRTAKRPGALGELPGLEEQLKSPHAESLDGGCSSSSEDHAERVRQLSGQSCCSDQVFKHRNPDAVNALCSPAGSHGNGAGRPLSKEELMVQMCQEGKGGAMASLVEQATRRGEKPVGVIVSREAMGGREDVLGMAGQEDEHSRQTPFPVGNEKAPGRNQQPNNRGGAVISAAQNGNGLGHQGATLPNDPMAARLDSAKSPSCLVYGFRDMPRNEGGYHQMQYPAVPYGQAEPDQFTLGDRKVVPSKAEKSHSLLQEALQANYPGRKFHPNYLPDLQYSGFMDPSQQPGYPVRQMIELARKDVHGSALAPPSSWGDGRVPGFGTEQARADLEAQLESVMSERKSVICDVSPSRPFGRSSMPLSCGQSHDQDFVRNVKGEDRFCKAGQSVIQPGIPMMTEARIKGEMGQSLCQQRPSGHLDSRDGRTLSPHWKYDPSDLVRGSTMISTPLPMGPTTSFPHQALNNRSTRGRRPYGRGAGRGGGRKKRPSARADGNTFLTRAPFVKQEVMPEAGRVGHFGQPCDHMPPSLDKVTMYPGSANSDTLSSLLTKQVNSCSSGMESEATMRYPIHSQKQMQNPEGMGGWADTIDGKNPDPEICRSGMLKEPRLFEATQQDMSGHPSLQMFSPQGHDIQSPQLAEQSIRQEDAAVQSSILSRRRIRSFISPIPAKRFCQEPKAKDSMTPCDPNNSQCSAGPIPVHNAEPGDECQQMNDEKGSPGGSLSPAASLASPGKTKTLPPRKGRGLKLEAIVQKITSPNGRKFPPTGMLDGASDSLTLEDILSVSEAGWERTSAAMVLPGFKVDADAKEGDMEARGPGRTGEVGHANCSQICKDFVPSARAPHHPDSKQCGPPCPLPCSLAHHAGEDATGFTAKVEASIKGYFPSGKKRGRPLGSINKQKRHRQECQDPPTLEETEEMEEEEEEAKPKVVPESKKPASHQRRRRKRLEGPMVLPIEPDIKLKHTIRTVRWRRVETQDKGFSPYVLLERKREAALCTIINNHDDQNRAQKGVKGEQGLACTPPPSCAGKALPTSSHMVQGPVVTDSSTLGVVLCCLCGKCANHRDLGDLYGPYYPHQYAATLPKNPPPKKMVPVPSRVVRHRSMPDLLKTSQSGDEGKEFGTVPGHPRLKRRHYSEDCTPSWASPRSSKGHRHCHCCVKTSVDSRTQRFKSELGPQVELQLPQLPLDPNELWIHESCVLWASGVYLISGRLYGLQEAVEMARETKCSHCQEPGATLGCYCKGCPLNYHYICAMEADCFLNEENFSMKCPKHKHRATKGSSTEQSERG
ncbi:transcription factor 20 isoform X2 [Amblyraja radiata]|uniref:transcription factor 20 isoform X2 n=1 Tax=Amblyraja radiata TaxID=386614 RepID=UPI001401BB43|nr:transcription factor 20 isoform X2 [Amblyraja radiata]